MWIICLTISVHDLALSYRTLLRISGFEICNCTDVYMWQELQLIRSSIWEDDLWRLIIHLREGTFAFTYRCISNILGAWAVSCLYATFLFNRYFNPFSLVFILAYQAHWIEPTIWIIWFDKNSKRKFRIDVSSFIVINTIRLLHSAACDWALFWITVGKKLKSVCSRILLKAWWIKWYQNCFRILNMIKSSRARAFSIISNGYRLFLAVSSDFAV